MSSTPIIEVRSASRQGVRVQTPGRQVAVLMDRDGVLNRMDHFVNTPAQMQDALIPESMEALGRLDRELPCYKALLTNQGGVDEGHMTPETNRAILQVVADQAEGHLDAIYFCPDGRDYHAPAREESARKPEAGMFLALAHDLGPSVDLADSYYIGDMTTDIAAAKAAYPGMVAIQLESGMGGKDGKCHVKPDVICRDFSAAVDYIIARERNLRLTNT